MAEIIYESEPLYGGNTLTVGAVRAALEGLPDDAFFWTTTDKEEKPWPTKILVASR